MTGARSKIRPQKLPRTCYRVQVFGLEKTSEVLLADFEITTDRQVQDAVEQLGPLGAIQIERGTEAIRASKWILQTKEHSKQETAKQLTFEELVSQWAKS